MEQNNPNTNKPKIMKEYLFGNNWIVVREDYSIFIKEIKTENNGTTNTEAE